MHLFDVFGVFGRLTGRESGSAFIEVLASLALLGLIAVAFLSGLATTSKAAIVASEQSIAEGLARGQMEWVKGVGYTDNATEYTPAAIPSAEDYTGYSATITAEPLHNPDDGIQKITVKVKHYDKEVYILEGYKVDR